VRDSFVLVDTGPLVAFFDARERHHAPVVEAWRALDAPAATVWPVLAETFHLLDRAPVAREAMFDLLETRSLTVLPIGDGDIPRVRELMARYADTPMDLADACLVRVAERELLRTVFTLDRRGFSTYAPRHVRRFSLLPARLGP
jgi:predicted nucleic acid-binding protein